MDRLLPVPDEPAQDYQDQEGLCWCWAREVNFMIVSAAAASAIATATAVLSILLKF